MQWHRGRDDRFGDDEGCGVRGRGVRSRGVHDHQTRTCFSFAQNRARSGRSTVGRTPPYFAVSALGLRHD